MDHIVAMLGVSKPETSPEQHPLAKLAAEQDNRRAVLRYWREALRRGHGWTHPGPADDVEGFIALHGGAAAMAAAWRQRIDEEPEWPGLAPPAPGERLVSRSRGEIWCVLPGGQLVTLVMRATSPGHEAAVSMVVEDRLVAAVVEDGGRWMVRDGAARLWPKATIGAHYDNPRHCVTDTYSILVEGARRALRAKGAR